MNINRGAKEILKSHFHSSFGIIKIAKSTSKHPSIVQNMLQKITNFALRFNGKNSLLSVNTCGAPQYQIQQRI